MWAGKPSPHRQARRSFGPDWIPKMTENKSTVAVLTRKDTDALDADGFKRVAGEIRARREGVVSADGYVMYDAAVLMGAALDSGMIGKSEDAVWRTQGAYATSVGYTSSSQSTLLPRLAKAITLGVKVDTPQWTLLTRFGDKARVGAVVKAAESAKDLRSGLAPLIAEAKKTGTVGKVEGETRGSQSPAPEKEAEVKVAPPTTVKDILHALHSLRGPIGDLTDEGWQSVKEAMLRDIAAQDNRRALLNQKAAKEAAKAKAEAAA